MYMYAYVRVCVCSFVYVCEQFCFVVEKNHWQKKTKKKVVCEMHFFGIETIIALSPLLITSSSIADSKHDLNANFFIFIVKRNYPSTFSYIHGWFLSNYIMLRPYMHAK